MRSSAKYRAVLLLSGLLLVVFGFVVGTHVFPSVASERAPIAQQAQPQTVSFSNLNLSEEELTFANLYAQVVPSVVSIRKLVERK